MTQIFLYDNSTGSLKLDLHEILLVKEFDTLWNTERNKCSEDKKGENYLSDFIKVVNGEKAVLPMSEVISSTRATLEIQRKAN
jgi:hypothetical protein